MNWDKIFNTLQLKLPVYSRKDCSLYDN